MRSTRRLVGLCAVLTLVPLALLAILSIRLSAGAVEDNAKAQVRSNAAMTVNTFQSAMADLSKNLASFAARPTLEAAAADANADPAALRGLLAQLRKEQDGSDTVFLTGTGGRLRSVFPSGSTAEGTI